MAARKPKAAEESAAEAPAGTEAGFHKFLGTEETWVELPDGTVIDVSPDQIVEIPAGATSHLWEPSDPPTDS